jgi:hypothetical protein
MMRTWIPFSLMCTVLVGCAQAQSPVEIADGRTERPTADVSQWAAATPVLQAIDAARSYWQERDPNYEEEVRVLATATGAFTQPGVEQQAILYLMSLWPRCCPKIGLAILEGDQLIRNVAFESVVQDLWAVPDLDGDERDELVFDGTFGMGGQWSRSVTLVGFGEKGLRDLGSTSINDSACAAGHAGSTAARLFVVPGSEIMIEHFSQPTCETETWERVGEPEPLSLTPPEESPYVDIAIQ